MSEHFKKGERVKVFNQVSRDWIGIVEAVNKYTYRISVERLPSGNLPTVFTHHRSTREEKAEAEYLVPFMDATKP